MRRECALGCTLIVLLGRCAAAQTAPSMPNPRVTISAIVGNTRSGTAVDLERAMRSAGYTEDFGGCDLFGCVETSPSPHSYSHANPSLFAIRYALTEHYGVELLLGGGAQGETSGRAPNDEFLDLAYSGTVIAPTLSVGVWSLRALVGPALLRANWDYRSSSSSINTLQSVRTTSLGLLAGASGRLPIFKQLYLEGTAQQRLFSAPTVRPSQAGRPAGPARVAHTYWGLGVGMGFR